MVDHWNTGSVVHDHAGTYDQDHWYTGTVDHRNAGSVVHG